MYNSNIDERPLPLPRAPINPSKDDINVLKMYITKKYPTISDVFPEWVDYSIKKVKNSIKRTLTNLRFHTKIL